VSDRPIVHRVVHHEDKVGVSIPTLPPTLEQLITHARRYGVGGVYEAAELCFGPKALARLQVELDAIEAGRKSGSGFSVGKRRRRSREQTRAAVVQLSLEGFVVPAIADKLGISDKTVRNYLAERPERDART
jgi:DNA-binding NarL/FixJ family response regulator